MILQSLVQLYEDLVEKGEITKPGWCKAKVAFALVLSEDGKIQAIHDLRNNQEDKKVQESPDVKDSYTNKKEKAIKQQKLVVPQMLTRQSGINPNFLCDHSGYFLGVDKKGNQKRSEACFKEASKKHLELLKEVDSPAARAVCRFFENGKPDLAEKDSVLSEYYEEIIAGENIVFCINETKNYVHEDPAIKRAWDQYYESSQGEEGICLVTGKREPIEKTHGVIKGVKGAQSSGANLVSFNAAAFESYGKEQSYNAPVGKYAVYAYTTALNYLLSDKNSCTILGDTTIVYWAKEGEDIYPTVFNAVTEPTPDNQGLVNGVFKNLAEKKSIAVDIVEKELSVDQPFYILGLSPNAARLSVRFFYQGSFGEILNNLKEHYDNMNIVKPINDKIEYFGVWRMLLEVVNKKSKDKKAPENLTGNVYRAIMSGTKYPEWLYQAVLLRIRAEQDDKENYNYKITRGRAAIIKAFLLKNREKKKEEITMALNESCNNTAYVLGRMFSVLEEIQEKASTEPNTTNKENKEKNFSAGKGLNTTIKDRYFNSACATPAVIFPILFKLGNNHLRKLKDTKYYEKLIGQLQEKFIIDEGNTTAYPKRLTLEEQGLFILGYYHQNQKRYEKRSEQDQTGND